MNVGFIGLGIMGAPMAANLVRAGFPATGYDVAPAVLDRLVEAGGKPADSIAQAIVDADAVITMLPDWPQVEQVVLGEDGVLDHAAPGALLIDMSTVRPETARRIASFGAARDLRVLDAPVSGGERGAVDGVLSIMVGGTPEDFAAARPVLEPLGRTIVHVGPIGAGQLVKAANQLVVGGTTRSSPRRSCREAEVALPVGALVAALIAAARAQGHGALDHSALLKVTEQLSGRRS